MPCTQPAQPSKKAPWCSDGEGNFGYNAATGEYVDMIEAGIIDPAKVTRGALENAASIASMILTTEALITDIPEEEKPPMAPPGGGMPY